MASSTPLRRSTRLAIKHCELQEVSRAKHNLAVALKLRDLSQRNYEALLADPMAESKRLHWAKHDLDFFTRLIDKKQEALTMANAKLDALRTSSPLPVPPPAPTADQLLLNAFPGMIVFNAVPVPAPSPEQAVATQRHSARVALTQGSHEIEKAEEHLKKEQLLLTAYGTAHDYLVEQPQDVYGPVPAQFVDVIPKFVWFAFRRTLGHEARWRLVDTQKARVDKAKLALERAQAKVHATAGPFGGNRLGLID